MDRQFLSTPRIGGTARIVFLLILASLFLPACGGGGSNNQASSGNNNDEQNDNEARFVVGGNVAGLSGTLQISIRSGALNDIAVVTNNGEFKFAAQFRDGADYNVAVTNEPTNQRCDISNGRGVISGADISSIGINCINLATLSGALVPAVSIGYDSDVNDLNTSYSNNDSASAAQILPNNVYTLHGFASAEGVGKYGLSGRFANSADEDDFFKVILQENQRIQLDIVDYTGFDVDKPLSGDLDLYLYRFNPEADEYQLEDFSFSADEFEEVSTTSTGEYLIRVHAYSSAADANPGASKYVLRLELGQPDTNTRTNAVDFESGEMIVKFNENRTDINATNNAKSLAAGTGFNYNHQNIDRPVVATFPLQTTLDNQATNSKSLTGNSADFNDKKFQTLQTIKWMASQDDVDYAEPNYILQITAAPDDEYYDYQWHYPLINLPQAWDISTGLSVEPAIVAVVDTGVYLNHPDLRDQLIPGFDFISNANRSRDGDGIDSNPDDPGDDPARGRSSWHGTHVAGTIAAQSDDGSGVAGVAWHAQIMPIRVLGYGGGSSFDILEGMRYAAGLDNISGTVPTRRADVINLSLGGGFYSRATQDTIDEIRNAGVIIIAAAGNDNSPNFFYPASYDGVVSVSAVTFDKVKASYSNYGRAVDVAAPGGQVSQDRNGDGYGDGVLSSVANDASGVRAPAWSFYQGTSMASPHVVGVAALMKAVYPALTPEQFDALLESGSITQDLGEAGRDNIYGHGLIDANLALRQAQQLAGGNSPPLPPPQLSVEPSSIVFGLDNEAILVLSNSGGPPAPSIVSLESDVSWLTIASDDVDANGLGEYLVSADTANLEDGTYQATIDISYYRAGELNFTAVSAAIQVGTVISEGLLNTQYVLLIDADTSDPVQTTFTSNQNGVLHYQFDRVGTGNYFIYSGTDIDNDKFICQSGESCGAFPSLTERQAVNVSAEDISDLDISVDILGGINSGSSSTASTTSSSVNPLPIYLQKK